MAKVESNIPKDAWTPLDKIALTVDQAASLAISRASYQKAKADREAFEQSVASGLPPGMIAVWSWKFGGSVAIIPDDGRGKANGKAPLPKLTLAEHLERLKAQGRAV